MKRAIPLIAFALLCGVVSAQETEQETLYKTIVDAAARLKELADQQPEPPDPPDPPDPPPSGKVDFDIVQVKAPRTGGETRDTHWQEAHHPDWVQAGADLVLRKPDGTEAMLVDATGDTGVMDPVVHPLHKHLIFYALAGGIKNETAESADLWVVHKDTRETKQITFQPEDGSKVLSTGPCPLGNGRVIFTKAISKVGYLQKRIFMTWVIGEDGRNEEQIGYWDLGGALHWRLMLNGQILGSRGENFGARIGGQWAIFKMNPDGSHWGPSFSAFVISTGIKQTLHPAEEIPDGPQWLAEFKAMLAATPVADQPAAILAYLKEHPTRIVATSYYIGQNHGSGSWLSDLTTAIFGSPDNTLNGPRLDGLNYSPYPFQPDGLVSMSPVATDKDVPNYNTFPDGTKAGKMYHMCNARGGLLGTWTGPYPSGTKGSTLIDFPLPRGTTIFVPDFKPLKSTDDFIVLSVDDTGQWDYLQPQAVLTFKEKWGCDPIIQPWRPDPGTPELPEGTPYAEVWLPSIINRETKALAKGWTPTIAVGADVGEVTDEMITKLKVLRQFAPSSTRSFASEESPERVQELATIDLIKRDADGNVIMDADGNPDTSVKLLLIANDSYTFQACNDREEALFTAHTWHFQCPGSINNDCTACHLHHGSTKVKFRETWAAQHDALDLTEAEPKGYDFTTLKERVLDKRCGECHNGNHPDAPNLYATFSDYWNDKESQPALAWKSRLSNLTKRLRLPIEDPMHMPPGIMLPEEEILEFTRWQDTGLQNKDANRDQKAPTLRIKYPQPIIDAPADSLLIGTADYGKVTGISVTCSWLPGEQFGNCVALDKPKEGRLDNRYRLTFPQPVESGEIAVIATDKSGNKIKMVRTFKVN